MQKENVQSDTKKEKFIRNSPGARNSDRDPGYKDNKVNQGLKIDKLETALDFANGIIDTVREPLVVLYPKMIISSANESFYKTFHVTPEKTIGTNIYEFSNGVLNIPNLKLHLEEVLPQKKSFYDFEVGIELNTSDSRIFLFNANRLHIPEKEDPMILLAMEDITYRKQLEKELNNTKDLETKNRHLLDVGKQKDDFIKRTSHELRTPLTTIKALAQILQFDDPDFSLSTKKIILTMNTQVDKIISLITDLLEIPELGGIIHYNKVSFDFNELVNETCSSMQYTTKINTIFVKTDKGTRIFADRGRIGQVMVNFLSNAIKFSPKSGSINVSTINEGDNIRFSVSDEGNGIPEGEKKKVFDKYYKIPGKIADTFPGLGLGLFISSEIINFHNGSIFVVDNGKQGSIFSFTLPIN